MYGIFQFTLTISGSLSLRAKYKGVLPPYKIIEELKLTNTKSIESTSAPKERRVLQICK